MVIRVSSVSIPVMPSLVPILDLKRTGEAAGRSLYPCVPQVDADTMGWLCSPHAPCESAIHLRPHSDVTPIRMMHIISILPVKPCRQR